jgi:hypothetical protein
MRMASRGSLDPGADQGSPEGPPEEFARSAVDWQVIIIIMNQERIEFIPMIRRWSPFGDGFSGSAVDWQVG